MASKRKRPATIPSAKSAIKGTLGAQTRRGRPLKFGRPSQVVALTLPDDVLRALRAVHEDLAWAIVQLVDRELGDSKRRERMAPRAVPIAELVHLGRRRALIVVQPRVFAKLRGVSTIPLADGRAFLAFDGAGGVATLELSILDRIEVLPAGSAERRQLLEVRNLVRIWRRNRALDFRTPHIIVVEGRADTIREPLGPIDGVTRKRGSTHRLPS
jgi:hypothetical protein